LLYQIFDIAENTLSAQKAIKFMALKLDQRQLRKKTRGRRGRKHGARIWDWWTGLAGAEGPGGISVVPATSVGFVVGLFWNWKPRCVYNDDAACWSLLILVPLLKTLQLDFRPASQLVGCFRGPRLGA